MTENDLSNYLNGVSMDATYYWIGKTYKVDFPKGDGSKKDSIEEHDKKYHHGEAPKGSCKYRDELKKEDGIDDLSSSEADKDDRVMIPDSELKTLFRGIKDAESASGLVDTWKSDSHGDLSIELLKKETPDAHRFSKMVKSGKIPEKTAKRILKKLFFKSKKDLESDVGESVSSLKDHRDTEEHSLDSELSSFATAFSSLSEIGGASVSDLVDYWEDTDDAEESIRSGYATGTSSPILADMVSSVKKGDMPKKDLVKILEKSSGDSGSKPVDMSKITKELVDLSRIVRRGARTVNRHIDRGDFAPNAKKLEALDDAERDLKKFIEDQKGSEYERAFAAGMLNAIAAIRKSVSEGAKKRVGHVGRFGRSEKGDTESAKGFTPEHSDGSEKDPASEYLEEVMKGDVPTESEKRDSSSEPSESIEHASRTESAPSEGVESDSSERAKEKITGSEIKSIVAKKYDIMKEADELEKKGLLEESIVKKNIGYSLSHFAARDGGLSAKSESGEYTSSIEDGVRNMRDYLKQKYDAALKRHGSKEKVESSRSIIGIREAVKIAGGILGFKPYGFKEDSFSVKFDR